MKRTRLLVAFSLVSALSGQSMATSPDGEQVWLASSWFLRDAVTEGRNFIFRRDASGSWSEVTHGAEFAAVFAPRPTADGSIIAWRRAFPCRFCVVPPPSEVRGLDKPLQIPLLFVSFSPNGRYALSAGAGGQSEYELEDRQTGVVYKASAGNAPTLLLPGDDAAVTNNGTLVGRAPNGALIRWRPGTAGVTLVPDASNAVSWGASDDGRRVWLRSPEQGTLRSVDTATGASVVLAASDAFIIRMSADGGRIFWVTGRTAEAWVWTVATGESRRLATEAFDLAITPDGQQVWLRSSTGKLSRLRLDLDRTEAVLDGLPLAVFTRNTGVPGSALLLSGPVNDVEISVDGVALPRIDAEAVQVPWEFTRRGQLPLHVSRAGHPFELRSSAFFETGIAPQLAYLDGSGALKAAHEDFHGLVTVDDAAVAGSVIHTWMFGLGALDRPLATGEPGPRNPVAKPVAPMACYLRGLTGEPPAVGLEVPFVAYAPGLIGAYQVDLRIPANWPAGFSTVICEAGRRAVNATLPVRR